MLVVRGPAPLEDILYQVKKSSRIAPLQVLNGDAVLDERHVAQAARLALRAMEEGRNQADSIAVEFVRYAAGERQIRKALDKVGACDTSRQLVIVGFGPKASDAEQHFAHALGLPTDALPTRDVTWLEEWGIESAAIAATTPEHVMDLVLERCAAVDLMK